MASTSILLAGFIVGTYCVQLRGPGLAALLANGRLPELVLVGGALSALAVVVHLSVVRALAAMRGPTSVRSLLRRALELLESEGEASEAYAALPAEVRELVGLFESQRTREQHIEREKQILRQEMQELTQALERSSASLEPLPAASAGEFAGRVAQVWNQLLARTRGGAAPQPLPVSPVAPAASEAFPAWASGAVAATGGVTQRLQELEGRFAALQEQMQTMHNVGASTAASAAGTLFVPEEPLEAPEEVAFARAFGAVPFASAVKEGADVSASGSASAPAAAPQSGSFVIERESSKSPFTFDRDSRAGVTEPEADLYGSSFGPPADVHGTPLAAATEDPAAPLPLMPEPEVLAPEEEVLEADDADVTPTWTDVVPSAVPWTQAGFAEAAYDLPLPEPEVAPEPAPNPEEELRWSKSEVLQPTQPTKASESGYFEWTGASTRGSWKLRDAANEELTRDADAGAAPAAPTAPTNRYAPAPAPPATAPVAGRPGLAPVVAPSSQSFETYFPHFVGRPVGELEGRVAVSFEGKSAGTAASRPQAPPGITDPYADDAPQRPWRPTEYDT